LDKAKNSIEKERRKGQFIDQNWLKHVNLKKTVTLIVAGLSIRCSNRYFYLPVIVFGAS
jgi:hypothetical protein